MRPTGNRFGTTRLHHAHFFGVHQKPSQPYGHLADEGVPRSDRTLPFQNLELTSSCWVDKSD